MDLREVSHKQLIIVNMISLMTKSLCIQIKETLNMGKPRVGLDRLRILVQPKAP
jgi:hypothetical protein